jgi:hypothetical protein
MHNMSKRSSRSAVFIGAFWNPAAVGPTPGEWAHLVRDANRRLERLRIGLERRARREAAIDRLCRLLRDGRVHRSWPGIWAEAQVRREQLAALQGEIMEQVASIERIVEQLDLNHPTSRHPELGDRAAALRALALRGPKDRPVLDGIPPWEMGTSVSQGSRVVRGRCSGAVPVSDFGRKLLDALNPPGPRPGGS